MRRRAAVLVVLALLAIAAVAHADIQEQRRRLPPPPPDGTCADAIEGDWQSLFWTHGYWLARTLRVHRASPGSTDVVGTELIETWTGARDVPSRPASCDPIAPAEWNDGTSPLVGTFDGTRLDVRALRYDLVRERCGHFSGYSPDHFAGDLQSAGTEFHSTNDDGTNPETIVVFRRVACAPPTASPVVVVAPPRASRGCGCGAPGA